MDAHEIMPKHASRLDASGGREGMIDIKTLKLLLLAVEMVFAGVALLGFQMVLDKYWLGLPLAIGFGVSAFGLGIIILCLKVLS